MTKCYLIVEVNWNECGSEFPVEVWIDKEKAQSKVDELNKDVEFQDDGIAKFSEKLGGRYSWDLKEIDFKE